MKALNWIAWISGGIGLVIVLLGLIQLVFEKFIQGSELINYFHSGNSFFLITIVYVYRCQCKKE
jgi:hypothetical protein